MSRKKEEHEKEPNHERWLVSYADFITLLFAVFVVLYAMSQVDKARVAKVIASTNEAFGLAKSSSAPEFNVIDSDSANLVPIPDMLKQPVTTPDSSAEQKRRIAQLLKEKTPADKDFKASLEEIDRKDRARRIEETKKVRAEERDFRKIKENITEFLREQGAIDKVSMEIGPRGLAISLKDTEFFDSGKAVVRPESMVLLDKIAAVIGQYSNRVRIEGHTDNAPIKTALFPSNWELSTARATNIVHYLVETHSLLPEKLSATGYGEYRPIADNATAKGRQENRRVDVVLLSESGEQGEPVVAPQTP